MSGVTKEIDTYVINYGGSANGAVVALKFFYRKVTNMWEKLLSIREQTQRLIETD